MSDEQDDSIERTVFVGKECFVYKVPNRGPNGYVASDWKESDFMWKGRVRVVEQGDKCEIRLEDPMSGALFASCIVNDDLEHAVERVTDSSRYFVLRITSGSKTAVIGMGFQERNDAFDFNVSLEDHMKDVRFRREEKTRPTGTTRQQQEAPGKPQQPALDLGLKDGQTFRVSIRSTGSRRRDDASSGGFALAPPEAPARERVIQSSTPAASFGGFASAAPKPAPTADMFGGFVSAAPAQQKPAANDIFGVFSSAPAPTPASQSAKDDLFGGFGAVSAPAKQPAPAANNDFLGAFGSMSVAPARPATQPAPAQQSKAPGNDFYDMMLGSSQPQSQAKVSNPLDFLN